MRPKDPLFDRVVLIVLDGVGCGALPDAADYGDEGSNTLGHVSAGYPGLLLKHLSRWGVGHLTHMPTTPPALLADCVASFGRCRELSKGKDTTAGHWEMAGVVVEKPFATFPNGFPADAIERWVRENHLPGVLGNFAASGTEIIRQLGEEHLRTGKPILYTSADSVWQVAAHEEQFGLDRLYAICQSARRLCDQLQISRVIARPFVGSSAADFRRTHHRKDFSQTPHAKTMMEHVIDVGLPTLGIGKIWNIFNGRGIQQSLETHDNTDGMRTLLEALERHPRGLIFINLVDFDMNYGHRRDIPGFAKALEEFDAALGKIESLVSDRDLVLITADHGIDPGFRGTDHTREYTPLLVYGRQLPPRDLGERDTFADVGQTAAHALTGNPHCLPVGTSVLPEILDA